jgi:hypothetical protein
MKQGRAPVGWRHPKHRPGRLADGWHSIWELGKPAFALLAIMLAPLLILQNWRLSSGINAERATIESHQARIRYLNDKLEALAHLDTKEISPEIKSIAMLRHANDDGTFTVTKIVDVVSKQLPAKLVITSRGDSILRITVRPQKLENSVVYRGVAWREPSEASLIPQHWGIARQAPSESSLPQHSVEIEYPFGRYAIEVTSKDDDVTLDYKFAR